MKVRTGWLRAVVLLAPLLASGCLYPPAIMLAIMTPTQPWVTERMEDKYAHKNDNRTPIMPPLREGFPPPICEDPPSEQEVLRAMPRVTRGYPFVYEEFRDGIQIVSERLVDKIDPPRFFPLVGLAQLHHCHWKCTLYYIETIESMWPFPYRCVTPRVQVMYIDKDHLHLYPCGTPEAQRSVTRDLVGY